MVQWLRLGLLMQGVLVQSLVGELRFLYALQPRKQNKKQKQYCNKFNKDFKNSPHQGKKKEVKQAFECGHFDRGNLCFNHTIL